MDPGIVSRVDKSRVAAYVSMNQRERQSLSPEGAKAISDRKPLISWPRPHFMPGGGDAFLFYVAFTEAPAEWTVSGSQYRTAGFPPGLEVMAYGPDNNPQVVDGFRNGPLRDRLAEQAPDLLDKVAQTRGCVIFRGHIADPETLDYHRDVIGLLQWLIDQGAGAILDMTAAEWWSPGDWRSRVFDPSEPLPHRHVTIYASPQDDGRIWLHTRGMLKYGRPDISFRRVPIAEQARAADIVNRFIELQALGGIVAEGQAIRIAGVPDGMAARHSGDIDDPDFNNRHIAFDWPD